MTDEVMMTKEAVSFVLETYDITPYRLAKNLGLQPIMISNYLDNGVRMGKDTAKRFHALYGIEIADIYQRRKNDTKATPVETGK